MSIEQVLTDIHEKKFAAIDRSRYTPRLLRQLLLNLPSSSMKYSFLRPREQSSAKTLSGSYGFGAFPLHTDGAHQELPPDYIVLFAPKNRKTETLVADPSLAIDLDSEIARSAIFLAKRAGRNYLQNFVSETGKSKRIRYNADSMQPKNAAAEFVRDSLKRLEKSATHVSWSEIILLVVNNRLMLHGRGCAEQTNGSYIRRLELRC